MNHLLAFCLLCVLSNLAHAVDHQLWDELLQSHVSYDQKRVSSTVAYDDFRSQTNRLDTYLKQLSAVSMAQYSHWQPSEKLAFLINAYNAWTIKLVLTGEPKMKSIKELGNLFSSPWQKSFIPLLNELRSLDDIEHQLIRHDPILFDPRVHFALNCASKGCPALRAEAYRAEKLEQQLNDQARQFLSDTSRNRLDGNTLMLSPIFKWYKTDFNQPWRESTTLSSFLLRYADVLSANDVRTLSAQLNRVEVAYSDYDWSLNRKEPKPE